MYDGSTTLATDSPARGKRQEIALQPTWEALLKAFPRLGRVMCETRNEAGVHQRHGTFEQVDFYDQIGVVLGEEIDLRLLMEQWCRGVAIIEYDEKTLIKSFCFFDAEGRSILTVRLLKESVITEYDAIVNQFRADSLAHEVLPALKVVTTAAETELEEMQLAAFRQGWLALEDTAYFADLLKKFNLSREQGLRLAPEGYARMVAREAVLPVLTECVRQQLRVMIFMRTSGCLQIHTGPISNFTLKRESRIAITDADFSFEMELEAIASAWVVRKPTLDGDITSLELFDYRGCNVALFFGKRGRGQSEDFRWRKILAGLS